jgi:sugar-specific transcriptional regulator TrmB
MKEILEECGLSKNESIVYTTLSKIGVSTAYKISKEAKLFKANTYETLKRLVEKGLVSNGKINGKEMYEASDPSFLMDLLNKKKEKLSNILPKLRMMQKSNKESSDFNTYKGVDAFITLLYNLLEYNEEIKVYGAPRKAYGLLKLRIELFHDKRIKKKIRMKHIYNFKATERIRALRKMPYTPIKVLPEIFDSQVSTVICGEQVLFTIWNPPIKTIQIVDNDMAEAYKKYFAVLWEKASD